MAGRIYATISDKDGNNREFTVDEIERATSGRNGMLSELVNGGYTLKRGGEDTVFATIDLHPGEIFERLDGRFDDVPLIAFPGVSLRPGRYYAVYNVMYDGESFQEAVTNESDGILLTPDADMVKNAGDELVILSMTVDDENGAERPDPVKMYAILGGPHKLATVRDLKESLTMLAAFCVVGSKIDPEQQAIEEVTLAQFDLGESFVNHSLAMKTIKGMLAIAFGEESYTLTPKGNSRSSETYQLTGSTKTLSTFFAEDNGNEQEMARILETVHALITDKRAEGFVYNGRVWFTTAKILEEMSRTDAGTIRGRNYEKRMKLVDDALIAASGLQISGVDATGKTLNVEYFINAIRRNAVTFNGNTYRDVWGFNINGWTVNDYAAELEHAYRYPALLDMDKPLTVEQAAIDRYLKDKMHEARGKLYTKAGNPVKGRKSWVQTLSWDTIFEDFSPLRKMDGRQKKKLVEDFEKVLTVLANMDARNKLPPGRPLYINAYSERDGGKGRGSGKWRNLVIEYRNTMHTPNVNLL